MSGVLILHGFSGNESEIFSKPAVFLPREEIIFSTRGKKFFYTWKK